MNKRASGTPRRPRNPVAKHVRTPQYKQQVVSDKRWKDRLEVERKVESTEASREEQLVLPAVQDDADKA